MAFHLDLSDPDQARVAERLRTARILWLASVRPDGRPHLVPVWFLWEGATILVFSKPQNQKVRNLRQNPNVTVSLDDTDEGDDVIVLEGVAELVSEPTAARVPPAYAEKYAEGLVEIGLSIEAMAREYSQPIHITITRQVSS